MWRYLPSCGYKSDNCCGSGTKVSILESPTSPPRCGQLWSLSPLQKPVSFKTESRPNLVGEFVGQVVRCKVDVTKVCWSDKLQRSGSAFSGRREWIE